MREFRPSQVLLVEDNQDDVEILRRALERSRIPNELYVARDGQEALDLLFGGADGAASLRPDLVILDVNTPRVNGLEVLERIRASDQFGTMPVVVLTVSDREEDVVRSYQLGANTYIQKPPEFQQFVHVLEVLGEYWFAVAKLPRRAA